MLKAEFYIDRYKSCGDLADVAYQAMLKAKKIVANGRVITLADITQQELQPADMPLFVYFDDGSFLKIAEAPPANTKTSWGTYTDTESMN
jgi:hypothetical protein